MAIKKKPRFEVWASGAGGKPMTIGKFEDRGRALQFAKATSVKRGNVYVDEHRLGGSEPIATFAWGASYRI